MNLLFALLAVIPVATLVGCSGEPSDTGFAGLAAQGQQEGFRQPAPGDLVRLPADWGAHPEYRIEWWYLTANLETAAGQPLGLQWTQFRQGLEPRSTDDPAPKASLWPLHSAWMAHGAVSFGGQHWFDERFARGDTGQAGATAAPLQVWLDHWQLMEVADGQWQLSASGDGWSYELALVPEGQVVRHGEQGFSAKTPDGQGSMYFSLTDIAIEGEVVLDGQSHSVSGLGWLDREWSSRFLRSDQRGWDWFALRLDDGSRLMVFRVGDGDNAYRSGTWVDPQGQVHSLASDEIDLAALDYREINQGRVPVAWQLDIPDRGLSLEIRAPLGTYWNEGLYPYWESPVSVSGSVDGSGYMELTGYGGGP
ncbi:carotenoid 1,2-hydratase [Marinobacter bryozoorum]|uniref:lipocalin-like domain-containing protein n=1 Tax=Marinobacter bryozoorum TaxID=256324 RepID=UPI002002C5C9|nr:lipocalin-like domain-containing protein [Marinobacter bryozoorum]MCK7544925.1 carotenoid 1,2-hydratase [Marinobacter bryozoorum]